MSVTSWTVSDVKLWVQRIPSISKYWPQFENNEVDGVTLLHHLTKDDLRDEMAIRNLRDRQLLWEAVESLRQLNRHDLRRDSPPPITAVVALPEEAVVPRIPPPFQMPMLRYLPRPTSAPTLKHWYERPPPVVDLSAGPPMTAVDYRSLLGSQQLMMAQRESGYADYVKREANTS